MLEPPGQNQSNARDAAKGNSYEEQLLFLSYTLVY